jgi:hypothetical protein
VVIGTDCIDKTFYLFLQTNTKKTQPSNHAAEYDYEVDHFEDILQVAPGPKTKEFTYVKYKKKRGR